MNEKEKCVSGCFQPSAIQWPCPFQPQLNEIYTPNEVLPFNYFHVFMVFWGFFLDHLHCLDKWNLRSFVGLSLFCLGYPITFSVGIPADVFEKAVARWKVWLSPPVESKLWGPCQNWMSHFYLEQYFNDAIEPGLGGFHPSCTEDGVFWVTACPLTAVWKGSAKFHVMWQSRANRELIRCRHIVG